MVKRRKGSYSDLETLLLKEGFSHQRMAGLKRYESGIANFINPAGSRAVLLRVEGGKPARFTGRKEGLIRTHATHDIWELIHPKKGRK